MCFLSYFLRGSPQWGSGEGTNYYGRFTNTHVSEVEDVLKVLSFVAQGINIINCLAIPFHA
jgi:hypothetical protein